MLKMFIKKGDYLTFELKLLHCLVSYKASNSLFEKIT